MANPKVTMKAELEAKYRHKYEEKLKEAEREFARLLAEAHANYQRMFGWVCNSHTMQPCLLLMMCSM